MSEVYVKKEFIVKRISASKFEIYNGTSPPPSEKSDQEKFDITDVNEKKESEPPKKTEPLMPRQTVIQRAPPAPKITSEPSKREHGSPILTIKRKKLENIPSDSSPTNVILIKDAIMYRIVDILMWNVIGENQLKMFGHPVAPTYQVLWRVVYDSCLRLGAKKPVIEQYPQDHDCRGNITCFTNHVYQFLELCAPSLWKRPGWAKLSVEDILRRIYYEDLVPSLQNMDLRNNVNILQCHSDIILLEKWEKQKFTAVTWSGQKYFSQMSLNCPKCPQCSNRHF